MDKRNNSRTTVAAFTDAIDEYMSNNHMEYARLRGWKNPLDVIRVIRNNRPFPEPVDCVLIGLIYSTGKLSFALNPIAPDCHGLKEK